MRSADSYSSEGLHLDPRSGPPRYLDSRMHSPRLARAPPRMLPTADGRLPQFASEEGLDRREEFGATERGDWQGSVGRYFGGGHTSPALEPSSSPGSLPPHFPGAGTSGPRSEIVPNGLPSDYPAPSRQRAPPRQAGVVLLDTAPHDGPTVHGTATQEAHALDPELGPISEGEERGGGQREDGMGGQEAQAHRGEEAERSAKHRGGADAQAQDGGDAAAGPGLDRQASGGSVPASDSQSGGTPGLMGGQTLKERQVATLTHASRPSFLQKRPPAVCFRSMCWLAAEYVRLQFWEEQQELLETSAMLIVSVRMLCSVWRREDIPGTCGQFPFLANACFVCVQQQSAFHGR